LIYILTLLSIGVLFAQDTPPTTSFSFYDYFQGNWIVQRSVIAINTSEIINYDIRGEYMIEREKWNT